MQKCTVSVCRCLIARLSRHVSRSFLDPFQRIREEKKEERRRRELERKRLRDEERRKWREEERRKRKEAEKMKRLEKPLEKDKDQVKEEPKIKVRALQWSNSLTISTIFQCYNNYYILRTA